MTSNQNPEFDDLLRQMSELAWLPLDARERIDLVLRENFPSLDEEACS